MLDSGLVGGKRISPSVWRVCLANRREDAVNGNGLRPATALRFAHVEFAAGAEEWAQGFVWYWGNPPKIGGLEEELWGKHARV